MEMRYKKYVCSMLIVSLVIVMLPFSGIMSIQTVRAKSIKKNGCYRTALIRNYPKSESYYMGKSPVLKKYKILKGKLITYGSYYYSKKITSKEVVMKKKKRTFLISKKCTYWDDAFNPSETEHRISKQKFFAHVKSSMKRNLFAEDIMFTVKKGKIVKMEIGQG